MDEFAFVDETDKDCEDSDSGSGDRDSNDSGDSTVGFTYVPGTRPEYPFVFVPAFGKRPVGKFKTLTETPKGGWKGKT